MDSKVGLTCFQRLNIRSTRHGWSWDEWTVNWEVFKHGVGLQSSLRCCSSFNSKGPSRQLPVTKSSLDHPCGSFLPVSKHIIKTKQTPPGSWRLSSSTLPWAPCHELSPSLPTKHRQVNPALPPTALARRHQLVVIARVAQAEATLGRLRHGACGTRGWGSLLVARGY